MAVKTSSVRIALNPSHMLGLADIMETVRGLQLETTVVEDDGSVFWVKGHEMAVDALLQKLAGSGRRAESLARFYAAVDGARARIAAERAEGRLNRQRWWLRLRGALPASA